MKAQAQTAPVPSGTRLIDIQDLVYQQAVVPGGSERIVFVRDPDTGPQPVGGGFETALEMACGDWDGDGLDDFAVLFDKGASSDIVIREADGGGEQINGIVPPLQHLAMGDWDGDGLDELVLVQMFSPYRILGYNQDGSTFQIVSSILFPPRAVACGDWDSDGRDDVAYVTDRGSTQSDLYLKLWHSPWSQEWLQQSRITHLAMGDWDAAPATADTLLHDEIIVCQNVGGSSYAFRARDFDGNVTDIGAVGAQLPRAIASGDWDQDARDDLAYVVDVGDDWSTLYVIRTSDGSVESWGTLRIFALAMGDWDGDSVGIEYLNYWTPVATNVHPICLLYYPPFLDRLNDDGNYSRYATGSDQGSSESNMIGAAASATFSYSVEIPVLVEVHAGLTVKGAIERSDEHSYRVERITGRSTGDSLEPYVVTEATTYRAFRYRIVNGPYADQQFYIDIPQSISPTCWELDYYNSHCDPSSQITPDHATGDPESYRTLYPHDPALDSGVYDVGQGGWDHPFAVVEDDLTSYTLSAGVDLTAGIETVGPGFEVTRSVYGENTHEFTTGSSTFFEGHGDGIESLVYDDYRYSIRMYVRRHPTLLCPIIDYYVEALGPGYSDETAPQTTITSGPSGVIGQSTATFTWTGSDNVTPPSYLDYKYRIDSGDWIGWTDQTSVTFYGLTDGDHEFCVRARDLMENVDPSPACSSFAVDMTAPVVTIDSGPSGTITYSDVTFTWHGSDPPFSPSTLVYSWRLEPIEDWSPWGIELSDSYDDLENGTYTFKVKAKDQVGHESAVDFRTFTVDAATPGHPPVLSTVAGWPDGVDPDSGDPGTTFTFKVHYYDEDGDLPVVHSVVIDGAGQSMSGSGSDDDYTYQASGFEVGTHAYYFDFDDGHGNSVQLPDGSAWTFAVEEVQNQPPVVSEPLPVDGATEQPCVLDLSVLAEDPESDVMTARFYLLGGSESFVTDTEAQWLAGSMGESTATDGSGSLILALDESSFGSGQTDLTVPAGGSYTLPGDSEYRNVTVGEGALLNTVGFTLRVCGTLTNRGVITDNSSGGAGGAPGDGGAGGDPWENSGGPEFPEPGQPGGAGGAGAVPLAGSGGSGAGGGGGGGGAWTWPVHADADGGEGGGGGAGGRGGGYVRIYARNFNNVDALGVIQADGLPGLTGANGGSCEYFSWGSGTIIDPYRDLAGGGGGGGAGGSGGDGGTVEIYYAAIISEGTVRANGGAAGVAGFGGFGHSLVYGVLSGSHDAGASGGGSGGAGGMGEHRAGYSSEDGANGGGGVGGSNGSVVMQSVPEQYAPLGEYVSVVFDAGETAVWQDAVVTKTTPPSTSVTALYSTGGGWTEDIQSLPESQCVSFKLILTTSNLTLTPEVDKVVIHYRPRTLVGTVEDVADGSRPAVGLSELAASTEYTWQCELEDAFHTTTSPAWSFETGTCSSGLPEGEMLPSALSLAAPAPNPFCSTAVLRYAVPAECAGDQLKIQIFSLSGKLVRTLAGADGSAGFHETAWDGTDDAGRPVGSGVYFVRLETQRESLRRRVVLLK